MNKIIDFVENAFSGIPNSQKKSEIKQEIIERIEDNAKRLADEGKEYEDAVNKAIVDFGDLGEIIEELKEKNIPNDKSSLWFSVTGALVIIGLVIFINLYYSKDIIWWVYPAFAVLWWPMCVFFFGGWRKNQ